VEGANGSTKGVEHIRDKRNRYVGSSEKPGYDVELAKIKIVLGVSTFPSATIPTGKNISRLQGSLATSSTMDREIILFSSRLIQPYKTCADRRHRCL